MLKIPSSTVGQNGTRLVSSNSTVGQNVKCKLASVPKYHRIMLEYGVRLVNTFPTPSA